MSLQGTLFRLRQNSLGEHSPNWPGNTYSRPTNAQVFARFRPRDLWRHRDPLFWEHERLNHHDRDGFSYEEGPYEEDVLLRLRQNHLAHFCTDLFYETTRAGDLHVSVDRYGSDDYAHYVLLQREQGVFRRLRARLRRRAQLREAGLECDNIQYPDQQLLMRLRGGAGPGHDFGFRDDETTLKSPSSHFPLTENVEHQTQFTNRFHNDIPIQFGHNEEAPDSNDQWAGAQGNLEARLASGNADAVPRRTRYERSGHFESLLPSVQGNRAVIISLEPLTTDGFHQHEASLVSGPAPPPCQSDNIQHYAWHHPGSPRTQPRGDSL